VQVSVPVVPCQHQPALAEPPQQPPPGVQGGEQDVAQLARDLHQAAELRDPHPQQGGARHGDTGQEGPLAHQHPQLADEVALLDDEDDPVVPAVDELDPAAEDEVEVVGVPGVPQQLARLGMQHLAR
jgi:hypothetical protein